MTPVEGLRVYAIRQSQPGIGYVAGVLTANAEADILAVEWTNGRITQEVWGQTVRPCQQ